MKNLNSQLDTFMQFFSNHPAVDFLEKKKSAKKTHFLRILKFKKDCKILTIKKFSSDGGKFL